LAKGHGNTVRAMMVLSDLRAGGAQISALQLVRALANRDYEFTIVSIENDGSLEDAFRRTGAEVHAGIIHGRGDVRGVIRLGGLLRRRRCDAVVIVDIERRAMFYGLTGSLMRGPFIRRVVWCKSIPGGGMQGLFVNSLRRYSRWGLMDVAICPSWWQRGRLVAQGLPPHRIGLIRNGVELSPPPEAALQAACALPAVSSGRKIIVQVAHVLPEKDFDTLFKAIQQLAHVRDDFALVLIGKGTDRELMRQQVRRFGIEHCTTLLGHSDGVAGILARSYVFVLSSRSEIFSVATLEAMAAGLPVVVSDLPGFTELFTPGREGLKFALGDEDQLAQTLAQLLDDCELRDRLAASARKRAQAFGIDRMADNWDRLLRTLAKK
jgi:glycosyltransferase involved in cell wall biosynthesis